MTNRHGVHAIGEPARRKDLDAEQTQYHEGGEYQPDESDEATTQWTRLLHAVNCQCPPSGAQEPHNEIGPNAPPTQDQRWAAASAG